MNDELFTRDEVLGGGLSRVRRARACLYLIEQEALRLVDRQARTTTVASAPPEAGMFYAAMLLEDEETMRKPLPGEADEAYIESFRNARRTAPPATLAALERSVSGWKVLIPEELALRAELLHQMSLRHQMPRNRAKHIAAAFGVGDPGFDAAYAAVAGSPVDDAFGENASAFGFLRRRKSAKG